MLEEPNERAAGKHVVRFYDDEETLRQSVATFVGEGLRAGTAALVVATPSHWRDIQRLLADDGHLVGHALESSSLAFVDARTTLESIVRGGRIDAERFRAVAGALLERLAPGDPRRPVRVYGEMVGLLCRDGRADTALELERLWSELGRRKRVTLFCGYLVESFKRVDERTFAQICAEHAQVFFPGSGEGKAHTRLKAISEAERRLKEAEGFRLLVDGVKDYAIYMLDPRGMVTSWNAGAERIKGYAAKEIVGSHFSRFYPESEVLAGRCELELEVAARDGRFEDEGYRLRKDGTRFWANFIITALRDEQGALVGYAKVTRDLTERRKAEQERLVLARVQEASRVKDEFLATISHELRTPLTAILGWATLLGARTEDPYLAKGIETIRRNAQAQARIIEDMLDVARIASGKLGMEPIPLDFVTLVRASVDAARPSAEVKGVALTLSVRAPVVSVRGDPTRLQQVLWNLLSNAVKFTPRGGEVEVELDASLTHAHLTVADTGIGIEPEFLPHVFERFRQADGSSARRAGGVGLGLSIARHLVELHGGQINAESEGSNRGAVFAISLPLSGSEAEQPSRQSPGASADAAVADQRLDGVRVLVVEDDPDARELIGALLESRGAGVELTSSAAEAYAALERALPDVIVSDIGMPDEDGYSFVRTLRALPRERGSGVPVVALTAYASAQERRRALEAGYSHHLPKPVDSDELLRVLGRLVRPPPSAG